jgi:hypothetical protein
MSEKARILHVQEVNMYVGLDISKEEIYVGSNLNKKTFKVENNEKGFQKLLDFINSASSL